MKLHDIAEALGGRLVGDGNLLVKRPVHPAHASAPDDLALAMDRKLVPLLAESAARLALVAEGAEVPEGAVDAYIVVTRPRFAMAGITAAFERPVHRESGIHASAVISPKAQLGTDVVIGPLVVIGPGAVIGDRTVILSHCSIGADARIGADGLLHPGVRVGDRVEIGDRVILHHNASIGADGFSFVTPERGSVEAAKATGRVGATNQVLVRIQSLGSVIMGNDVEMGANSAIDRGTITDTRIGHCCKIDNLVQIGHNVTIGDNCMICGQVGVAGSVRIGNRVVLAGGVGVADHVTIGDDAVVAAMSGVGMDVEPRTVVMGYPAVPRQRAFQQYHNIGRLKALFAAVADLKERLTSLELGLRK